jgi:hypothetical protein
MLPFLVSVPEKLSVTDGFEGGMTVDEAVVAAAAIAITGISKESHSTSEVHDRSSPNRGRMSKLIGVRV